MNDKEIRDTFDIILKNQEVIYDNQIVIINLLTSIYSKVFNQSDLKDLMIDVIGNNLSYRFNGNKIKHNR